MYEERLRDSVITPELPAEERRHVFYAYTIRVPGGRRDALRKHLADRGIATQVYYPIPLHLQRAAEFLGYRRGDLPVTERLSAEVLSLPIYPELREDQLDRISSEIRGYLGASDG
jgi:dTDP-4-amino-4,6-dideoxygalactose transaminase